MPELIDTYKSLCTEFYDLDKPFAPEDALSYYLEEAKRSEQPILEPMCGSGRFLVPMLEHGINIEGADASKEMLDSCKRKCLKQNLNTDLYYQKIQDLKLPQKYGMVFIPAGSFGLISDYKNIKESLKNIFDCLIPGGKFIMEVQTPYIQDSGDVIYVKEVSRDSHYKIKLTAKTQYVTRSNIEITECLYQSFYDEVLHSSEPEKIIIRHYSLIEITELLRSEEFQSIRTLKPYSKKSAEDKDNMILVECFKS